MKMYGVEGSDPKNVRRLMGEKRNLMLVPGGYEEATLTEKGKDKVFIKDRKGFVKLALEFGYHLIPVYTFGESSLYTTLSLRRVGLFLNKAKIPGLLMYSQNGILPDNNVKLTTVVGKPIQYYKKQKKSIKIIYYFVFFRLPKIENASIEQINEWHGIYMKELENLYYKYRDAFGGSEKLEIY